MIDPNWNEFEKAMFLYNALVVDMTYVYESEKTKSLETFNWNIIWEFSLCRLCSCLQRNVR